jgi:hypothetical protein
MYYKKSEYKNGFSGSKKLIWIQGYPFFLFKLNSDLIK